MNERRAGDERLDDIIARLEALKDHLNAIENSHADFYGRMDQRVLNHDEEIKKHSDELRDIDEKIASHERWINIANGRVGAFGALFGLLGSIIGYVFDHFVIRGK